MTSDTYLLKIFKNLVVTVAVLVMILEEIIN